MKKLKSSAREWIFENLLRLIFKFSNSHKLVKFVKRPKDDSIYYDIQFKSKVDRTELLEAFENYLTNLTNKDVISERDEVRESKFNFMLPKWKNEGIVPDAVKESLAVFKAPSVIYPGKFHKTVSSSHEGEVLSEKESYLNATYKKLQKESIESSRDLMQEYIDLQVRTLKRSIEENGYEILSEVKNGFIIARKDRYTNDPEPINHLHNSVGNMPNEKLEFISTNDEASGYVHTLRGRLGDEDKLIKEQLSTPDLSKQDFTKDFGVSESEMNEYLEKDMEKYESERNLSEKDFYKHIEEPENESWIEFAAQNKLFRFLDENHDKYMERIKSAMRSKFTKTSLHPLSGVIDNVEKSIETVKSINELAKTFDETYDKAIASERHISSLLKPFPTDFKNPLEKHAEELKTYATSEEGMKKIPRAKIIDLKKIQSNELNEEILNRKRPESNLDDIAKKIIDKF